MALIMQDDEAGSDSGEEKLDNMNGRMIATFGLMLATLTNVLDTTIANIALPHIQGSISASPEQLSWVLTSYLIAMAVMTPLSGRLAMRFGRKRLFLLSVFFFTIASMLIGMATSLTQIVAFRVLQGLAGASMMPMSQAALLDLWPRRLMPYIMAIWSSVGTIGPVVGPTLGGWLTDSYSWRWAFYINVPLDIIAMIAIYLYLPADRPEQQRPFDKLGYGALLMFMVGMQLVVDRGMTLDWFSSTEICIEAGIALLGLYLYLVQTLNVRHPFFDPAIFRDRYFITTNMCTTVIFTLHMASSALTPVMLQTLYRYSAWEAGLTLISRGLASVFGFLLVPFVARQLGARLTVLLGTTIFVVGMRMMAELDVMGGGHVIFVAGWFLGIGSAFVYNPLGVLAYATMPQHLRNETAALTSMVRNLTVSLGIAGFSAFLVQQTAVVRSHFTAHLDPMNQAVAMRLADGGPVADNWLPIISNEVARQSSMIAYNTVFGYMLLATLLLYPLAFFLPEGAMRRNNDKFAPEPA